MRKLKYGLKLFFVIALLFLLAGCRQRIISVAQEAQDLYEPQLYVETIETHEELADEVEIISEEITAPRYEPVIEEMADDAIEIPVDAAVAGRAPGDDYTPVLAQELEVNPVTIYEPTEAPGETTLDNEGDGTIGMIIDRYTEILNTGLGSLFECQRVYIYFETAQDFHTVNRTSAEHRLILESGGHNIAARRGNDALIVDSEWVLRRNPAVIVKSVSSDVLGGGVAGPDRAAALRGEILSRPGWEAMGAIINRQVLLISEELLATDEGRLIAKLHIARAMYPTLFSDVDIAQAHNQIKTASDADYTVGVFVYPVGW